MALARTTYGGGGSQTDVTGGADVPFAGGGPEGNLLLELARRRARQVAQREQLEQEMLREQLEQTRRAGAGRRVRPRGRLTLAEQNTERARLTAETEGARAATAQARALTERAPTRTSFIMGAGGHQTLDPLRMTGAQRQVFLPQAAGLSEVPTPVEAGRGAREATLGDLAAQFEMAQRANRLSRTGFGY